MAAMEEERRELEDDRAASQGDHAADKVLALQCMAPLEAKAPATTVQNRERKSIRMASKDPMWDSEIKPAIRNEIERCSMSLRPSKYAPVRNITRGNGPILSAPCC